MPFSRVSSLSQLLKQRPAAVELLESSKQPFWNQLDMSMEAFCHQAGFDPEIWMQQVRALPLPDSDADWSREPLYRVVDFLTAEHRRFREKDLPLIKELRGIPVHAEGYLLKPENRTFEYFEEGFLEHMHEEEERIFPYILRLEACTRVPDLKPVIHRDTFSLFAASNGHATGEKHEEILSHHKQAGAAAAKNRLYEAMEDFETRLTNHTNIETSVLFPRALEIEKQLLGQRHGNPQ